jgi:pimeloyl-ACP methyl ester carboxylesterase
MNSSHNYFVNNNQNTIIFFFHGFGASCELSEGLKNIFKKGEFQNFICVDSGDYNDSTVIPLQTQIENSVRHILKIKESDAYKELFKQGVYFVGFSQGGIIARMVFNLYDSISDHVRRLITVGTPNVGLEELKVTSFDFSDSIVNYLATSWIGKNFFSGNFYLDKKEWKIKDSNIDLSDDYYLLNCAFTNNLMDITLDKSDNEEELNILKQFIEKCTFIKNKYNNLEMFITIMYSDDQLILPPNSPILGQDFQEQSKEDLVQRLEAEAQGKINQYRDDFAKYIDAAKNQNPNQANYKQRFENSKFLKDLYQNDLNSMKQILENSPDQKYLKPVNYKNMDFYKNNILHLKDLIANQRYLSCVVGKNHLQHDIDELFILILRPLAMWTPRIPKYSTIELSRQLHKYRFIDYNLIPISRLYCDFTLINPEEEELNLMEDIDSTPSIGKFHILI